MSRAMKDSGIPWLGEIPSSWQVGRVKQFYSFITGFTPPSKNDSYYDIDGTPWITIGDMKGRWISQSNKGISKKYIDENNPLITPKGSLLYSFKLSVGQVALTDRAVYTNEAIASFLDKEDIDLGFLFYSSQVCIIQNANENIYGAKLLNQDLINNALIVFPPLKEQKSIADFLDKKCGEIDEMISLQEKIVEELKAYKQSIITEAVCKGLNPDVSMKDSGVERIGQIPEGWRVCRVKDILVEGKEGIKIGPFGSALTNRTEGEGKYKIYGQWNIVDKDFTAGKNYISTETYNELASYRIVSGDVLVSLMGTVGKCAVIPYDIQEGIMDSHVIKIRLNHRICSSFFEYIYDKDNSTFVYEQIQRVKKGSIMDGLNSSIVKSLLILLPPIKEQQAISDYLDTKCAEIDTLIALKQAKIDALKEYKKSIIYEYITGKKEVVA